MNISIDLGKTLINDDAGKIMVGPYGDFVYPLFPRAEGVIRGWSRSVIGAPDHKISIISKIDPETGMGVISNLFHWNLIPHVFSINDVHICEKPEIKATIARLCTYSHLHIDDSAEAMNWMTIAGVQHRILFTGARDESRDLLHLEPDDKREAVRIASDWDQIWKIVYNLSQ